MAHRLEPAAGHPCLSPTEVIRRLRNEFEYCNAPSKNFLAACGAPVAAQDNAHEVTIADAEGSPIHLTFFVEPNAAVGIEYDSPQHEAETSVLLERCAAVLECASVRVY